jgi:hypothetical protein
MRPIVTITRANEVRRVKLRFSRPGILRVFPHNRRLADIAVRGLGRLNWADSAPTGAASGTTGVRVIAVIADTVQRPFLVFDFTERRGSAFRPAAYRRGRLRNDWRSGRIARRSG